MRYASTIALTVFGLVFATVFAVPVDVDVSLADETFTFAIAGDIGWNETGAKSQVMLRALQRDKANLSFFLAGGEDRKSTRLNSSHVAISYAVCCLKKKKE